MTQRNFSFGFASVPTLVLKNLCAVVHVNVGVFNEIKISIQPGSAAIPVEQFKVTAGAEEARVEGNPNFPPLSGTVTVGTKTTVRKVTANNVTIVGGNLYIDGDLVGEGEKDQGIQGSAKSYSTQDLPEITILVPKSTRVSVRNVMLGFIKDVNGPVDVTLLNQNEIRVIRCVSPTITCQDQSVATVWDVTGNVQIIASDQANVTVNGSINNANVRASQQAGCKVNGVSGNIDVTANGQSSVKSEGSFVKAIINAQGQSTVKTRGSIRDVEATSSGMSSVAIRGDCVTLNADASGMSNIRVKGSVSEIKQRRSSGMSEIRITG